MSAAEVATIGSGEVMTVPHKDLDGLEREIRACTICADLPLGPKPIFQSNRRAKILIVGQAPGRITMRKEFPLMTHLGSG